MTKQAFYHPELDMLRFAAFLLVFMHHVLPKHGGLATIAIAGGYGVDLFFALSAYLITEILLREFRAYGSIDVKAFYLRRILRIWPLYLVVVLAGPPIAHWLNHNEHFPLAYLLGFLLFSGNLVCARLGFPASSFVPLWSVSIEEQFYLSWPLIMKRWAHKLHVVCFLLLALATASRLLMTYLGASPLAIGLTTVTRLDPIALGALLAFVLNGRVPQIRIVSRVALVTTGVAAILFVGSKGQSVNQLWALPLVGIGCVTILAGVLQRKSYSWYPLVYLGRISYGLYVFHVAAIHVVNALPIRAFLRIPLALALVIAVAMLSYRYLESPFLLLKERFNRSEPVSSPAPLAAVAQ